VLRGRCSRYRRLRRGIGALTAVACLALPDLAHADVYEGTPGDYREIVAKLRPGDTLHLAPGEYRDGLPIKELAGAPGRPIVIAGPADGAPATFVAEPGRNTVSIVDSSYVVIRHLTLEGHNVPVDAVKAEGHAHWAHHITLEDLIIRGHGNNQQNVAISTKCPAWNWVIRGVTITGAGTGMYLGNSDASAPFVAGLIERNLIVDSIGYNLQVKHQRERPDLPGMPRGPSTTIIRYNVFAKPNAGFADSARPNVLVGHFPRTGSGIEDMYAVYGNFFYQNRHEALFQGEGNVALYANVFVNDHGDAVNIQPHNDVPRRIVIAYNTVLAKGTGVAVVPREGVPLLELYVGGNAVLSGVPLAATFGARNFSATYDAAPRYLRRPLAPLGELDLHPTGKLVAGVTGGTAPAESLPDWARDFDGRTRGAGTLGAYGGKPAGSDWRLQLERKPAFRADRQSP
jgi:hypothetical protein